MLHKGHVPTWRALLHRDRGLLLLRGLRLDLRRTLCITGPLLRPQRGGSIADPWGAVWGRGAGAVHTGPYVTFCFIWNSLASWAQFHFVVNAKITSQEKNVMAFGLGCWWTLDCLGLILGSLLTRQMALGKLPTCL